MSEYYMQDTTRNLRDPVKLAALKRTDTQTLEEMAEIARLGVADLVAYNRAGVDAITGDFS